MNHVTRYQRFTLATVVCLASLIVPSFAAASLSENLQGYWKFDEGSGAFTVNQISDYFEQRANLQGAATWDASGFFGSGLSLDGVNGNFASVSSGLIDNESPQYTWSAWVQSNVGATGQDHILEADNYVQSARPNFGNGNLEVFANTTGGDTPLTASLATYDLTQWTHFAVTYQEGTALTAYVNGSAVNSVVPSGVLDPSNFLNIGADRSGNRTWDGTIDEVGIWDRTLSASEISDLYNGGSGTELTTPTGPELTGYWNFDETSGTIADNSAPGANDTTDGVLKFDAAFVSGGKFGNALSLDGTDDFVDVASQVLPDGAEAYTYTMWFKPDAAAETSGELFLAETDAADNNGWAISARVVSGSTDDDVRLFANTIGSGSNDVAITSPPSDLFDDLWHFVAMTYEQDGTALLYIDGIQVASDTIVLGELVQTTGLHIGMDRGAGRHWHGLLDDMSVWTRALTQQEIEMLWNGGAGNIATTVIPEPATVGLMVIGGLLLLRRRA